MQFQYPHEMGTIRLRFLVEDPDALYAEYRQRGVESGAPQAGPVPTDLS
ncbi:MAG TPA: hypothetical protein VHO06_06465 [Polyangia bacterium]|nr:hypothetical protein [Polyangia bacterium]